VANSPRVRTTSTIPCPGCNEVIWKRPVDKVCRRCQKLMEDGRKAREAQAQTEKVFVMAPDRRWWNYLRAGSSGFSRIDTPRDRLEFAMHSLLEVLIEPCLDARGYDTHSLYRNAFFSIEGHGSHSYWSEQDVPAFVDPKAREAVVALHQAILDSLQQAYRDGVREGSSLLAQLASGDITAEDFNKKTVLGDKNAKVYRD